METNKYYSKVWLIFIKKLSFPRLNSRIKSTIRHFFWPSYDFIYGDQIIY